MTKIKNILIIILGLIAGALAVYSYTISHKLNVLLGQAPTTVQITDTITNWEHDTMYFHSYFTDTLALIDTAIIYDTVTNTQFVEVQVPIYTYHFDTSIYYSNFSLSLHERVRGYGVTIDTLALDYNAIVTPPQPEKWYNNLGVGVGLMYGTSGFGIGVGLMYKL